MTTLTRGTARYEVHQVEMVTEASLPDTNRFIELVCIREGADVGRRLNVERIDGILVLTFLLFWRTDEEVS